MKYFKNTELARIYNVSEKSIRNWIQAASEGKLDLQLHEQNGKLSVANTSKNTYLIENLVAKGKKFKNSRGHKTIKPSKEFYETYTKKQILDIISNLSIRHEIPLQYSYVDGGANYWDQYANRIYSEGTANNLTKAIELLETTYKDLQRLIGSRHVNVIDLGPGNGLPVKTFLARLLNDGRLNRYIAIDNSQEMLDIVEENIKDWFKGTVTYESHIRDISQERFDDIFANDFVSEDEDTPINLVLLLGGTLSNFRAPARSIQAIYDSMSLDDLLIYTEKLDTPSTRRYFDFNIAPEDQKLTPRHKLILDYLNITEDLYDVEQSFDQVRGARFIRIKPIVDLTVKFEMSNGTKTVELLKRDPVTLWRAWHWSYLDVVTHFDRNDFDLLQLSRAKESEFCLLMLRIKST